MPERVTPKRVQNPLPPSPHRTTSEVSAVSASRHRSFHSASPSPASSRPTSIYLGAISASSPSAALSDDAGSSGFQTPAVASRKGKEKLPHGAEVEEVEVTGEMIPGADAKRGLRELVGLAAGVGVGLQDSSDTLGSRPFLLRRYYILTNAGKPVFQLHDDPSDVTDLMGVAQALISIFAEDDDKIRCISKGSNRIAFTLKAPLYLFCVSNWGEPEHVLRVHLEYIHLHILSVVSSTQLSRAFQRRSNFDLSRLLDGTENFLHQLIHRAQTDFSYFTSTLQPLRMTPALRDTAAAALMPPSKFKDLLYVLLVAGGHIVTLLRPRKHSIHPSDLHLLLNTLASSSTLRSSETWVPMCFPKFNPAGFVHAYVSYVLPDVGLVFVSADREAFEELRAWKEIVLEKLEKDNTLGKIEQSIPLHPYTVSALACPGLRHFVYKSRPNVQITSPEWEAPYGPDSEDQKRLVTLYHRLHDTVHARSGQSAPLKLVYIRTEHEACVAWITKPFELYVAVSPQLSKSAVVATANTVARWVAAEEGKIFLKDAPVF